MRILVTSSYYWPELVGNAPYVTGMAEHFAGLGHEVLVVSAFPHYPEWRPMVPRRPGLTEHRKGVEIRRRWNYVPQSQSAARRAVYEGVMFLTGLTAFPRQRPDAIIGISPIAGCSHAALAGRIYGRPYGLVFHDLIGQAARQTGVRGGARVANAVGQTELRLARGAAQIGVYSEGMRAYFRKHHIEEARITRVRPWTLQWDPHQSADEARRRLGWGAEEFICLHAGNMGLKQDLENVLGAAARLTDSAIRVVLAGDGNQRAALEREACDKRLANVSFVNSQSWGLFESMLLAADVLLVNQRGSVRDMAFPSKLTSYFPAGRPIVAAVASDGDTAREVERSGAGLLVPPGEPAELANAVMQLKRDPERARCLGAAGLRYAATELTPSDILVGYERFLDALLDGCA